MPLAQPTWTPEIAEEMYKKCCEENNVNPQTKFDIFTDSPEVRVHFLCKSKAFNVYTEDKGFHLDRIAYDPFSLECINKNKSISSHDEKVYKTMRCIADLQKNAQ